MRAVNKGTWNNFYKTRRVNLEYIYFHRLDFNTFYSKIMQYSHGKKLLETGIGTGISSIIMADKGFEVTSIDLDLEILKKAKKLNSKYGNNSINFIRMDCSQIAFKDNSLDLVFHQGVLEHFGIEEIRKIINEQLRVAPIIVFSVPSIRRKVKDFGDENLWSIFRWKRILEDFKIIEIFGSHYPRGICLILDRIVMKDFLGSLIRILDYFFAKELGFVIGRR